MSEFVKSVLVEVPNEPSLVLRTGGSEPVVEYSGGANFSEWIREIYIDGPLSPYYDDMIIEFHTSSVVSVKRSDNKGGTASSQNGLFIFSIGDGSSLYIYIDTSIYEMPVTGVIRIIDVNRKGCLSASPIISAFLKSKNLVDNLDNKIYPEWTDEIRVNNCIVEMYEEGSIVGSGKSFKYTQEGKWYYYADNWIELKNGINKCYNPQNGRTTYIIWRSVGTAYGSYDIKFQQPVIDISYSPALSVYIATEKLIEEKLSSITNQ